MGESMLQLIDIVKNYTSGDTVVHALKGVSMAFRESEFVSILGHSGCGKTTLLNIIGGLDHYTSGDLVINGVSTKEYKDRDWDNYRNHSIGFVFQSYNLIPHQTVLGNVELALTLSGVKRAERKELAQKALEKVGLGDQLNKRPNQLSGGQMQRVAIARALVNNPDIILADEPTGALDTETSVQIMELLKEVANDKLVVMVTHNPELAELYSSRIIRLKDGEVISDSLPFDPSEQGSLPEETGAAPSVETTEDSAKEEAAEAGQVPESITAEEKIETSESDQKADRKRARGEKKPSMTFVTAFSLSLRNLFTKKGRTFLTSFAGSIGIIGIALILSLSNGFQNYINRLERDTLSSYPIMITETSYSTDAFAEIMSREDTKRTPYPEEKTVYSNDVLAKLLQGLTGAVNVNDLKSFKAWIETNRSRFDLVTNAIKYVYNTNFCIYKSNYTDYKNDQLYPYEIPLEMQGAFGGDNSSLMSEYMKAMMNEISIWEELVDNSELLAEQYDVLEGSFPKAHEESDGEVFEVVLTVDKYNRISDYLLCAIGLKDIKQVLSNAMKEQVTSSVYDFEDLIGTTYKVVLGAEKYKKDGGSWVNKESDTSYMRNVLDHAITLKIAGIVRPKETVTSSIISGVIAYNKDLTEYVIEKTSKAQIVLDQKQNPETNVFTGEAFAEGESAESNLLTLGAVDLDTPSAIYIYAKGFDQKEKVAAMIKEYNGSVDQDKQIKYNDIVASLMGSVSSIIKTVSYVLIAFVSISLIVSSIMIGIITYISVLERTKEIGVLRSIGASKHDITRLFNAETLSIGFMSGTFGILVTILLNIPINIIISVFTGLKGIAALPLFGALILIAISMFLSFVAGFIPSKIAAKKDPVVALRTE